MTSRNYARSLYQVIGQARRRGNTLYLLKAALQNPNVIIVCRNQAHANELQTRYRELLSKMRPWNRHMVLRKGTPKFLSIENVASAMAGTSIPVVFDIHAIHTSADGDILMTP